MNRETKRAMARQQRTADQGARLQQLRRQQATKQQQSAKSATTERKRGGLRRMSGFFSDVMAELRKVNWPNRKTVAGYTVVVLVSVTILTSLIFGFDWLFGQAIVAIFT